MPRRHHREEQDHYRLRAHSEYLAYTCRYWVQYTTLFEDFPWAAALTGEESRAFAKELASFEDGDERILLAIGAWRDQAISGDAPGTVDSPAAGS